MVLKMWVHADELNVMKWGEKCHKQGRWFSCLGIMVSTDCSLDSFTSRCPARRWLTRITPRGHEDRLKIRTHETHPRSHSWRVSGWNLNPGCDSRGWSKPPVCSDHIRSSYRLSQVSNMGELNYFGSEFILSVSRCLFCLLCARYCSGHWSYSHKTEVSEIIALWMDEKMSHPHSPDIFVGTWVNYFHKSMSGVNTANLSCKSQCFND